MPDAPLDYCWQCGVTVAEPAHDDPADTDVSPEIARCPACWTALEPTPDRDSLVTPTRHPTR